MTRATGFTVYGVLAAIAAGLALTWGAGVQARHETPDGSAVSTARSSLDAARVNPQSGRVGKNDEAAIHHALPGANASRNAGGAARSPVDTYSLETLVCLHRAAEVALYAGSIRTGEAEACCGCSGPRNRSR